MPKAETVYACSKCGAQFPKWSGRCLSCGAWGTVAEENAVEEAPTTHTKKSLPGKLQPFAHDALKQTGLKPTNIAALDHVLGGGLVAGSVTLLAGEPGIGKSTLLAQAALALAGNGSMIAYVTGEESPAQVRRRLERLGAVPEHLLSLDDTRAEVIAATLVDGKLDAMIVDSIQSLRSDLANGEPGSVGQVKASAAQLAEAAKKSSVPLILVGQVTKDGDVAGPRVLEHLVDTVLFIEGDHEHRYRLLRALKHRFGPTDEVALLNMTERGLELIEDPSNELLRDRPKNASGSAVSCLIEGHRPMLIEVQALVSPAGYGTPVRRATGIDPARLGMLLAVLARRAGVQALDKDVYANATGGIDARDPSVDLALAAAIASATKDLALDARLGLFGEVGLAGELRPVSLPELRLKEFSRMGFTRAIVPKGAAKHAPKSMEAVEAGTLREALQIARLQ